MFLAFISAGAASAHAFLVDTKPRGGERLEESPGSITLRFSEPIAGGERLKLSRGSGEQVRLGPLQRRERAMVIEASVPHLPDGIYVVSWQVTGTDGDLSVGEFAFAVGSAGALPEQARDAGAIEWPESAAEWLAVAMLLVAFGALASERFIWSGVLTRHSVTIFRLPMGWLLAASLLGSVLTIALLEIRGVGASPLAGLPSGLSILSTRPGLLAAAQALLVGYALWLVPFSRLRPWALAPLTIAIIVLAFRGHPGTSAAWWAGPANALHLIGAAFWTGALAHTALVSWKLRDDAGRTAMLEGVRRYATLALVSVIAAVAGGILVALNQFNSPAELVETNYGRFLIAKLLLVAGASAFALVARTRALGPPGGPRPSLLRRIVRAESALLLAAVLVAALMSNTAPPQPAAVSSTILGPPPPKPPVLRLADLAGQLAVYLAASPEQLQVQVVKPSAEPAEDARLSIEGRGPDGTEFRITPRTCGPGCAVASFGWKEGTSTVRIAVRSEKWDGGTLRFDVPWPPVPEDAALFDRVLATMRSQPRVLLTESVSSGPGAKSGGGTFHELSGERFISLEPYAGGGIADLMRLPGAPGSRRVIFYLPGSQIWVLFEVDEQDRLRKERIVNPGHLIERTFSY